MKTISMVCVLVICLVGCGGSPEPNDSSFVRVEGKQFVRDGEPYRFLGANLWFGSNLGALAGAMTAPWVTGNLAQTHGLARAMLVPVIACTMIIVIQLVIIGTSRRDAE